MATIKVETSTRDAVRALAERQGVTMDAAVRQMTEPACTISRRRLVERIGVVEDDVTDEVLRWVRDWLA